MNKTMESTLSVPCSIERLQEMNVDWKTLTNGFDYDTVNRTIKLWKNYGERCMVARMIGSQMSVDNLAGVTTSEIQPVLDLLNMYRYREGSREYELMKERLQYDEERYRREKWERLQVENKRLKTQVEKLKEELNEKNELVEGRTRELDNYIGIYENMEKEIVCWKSEYENKVEENKKLQNENDLLKELVQDRGGDQKFSVRQTTIIAYALCMKADVLPKNKKSISHMFSLLTGRSENTIGQNMCANYKDEEINQLAQEIESSMPEFANYLREQTFFLPQKKSNPLT